MRAPQHEPFRELVRQMRAWQKRFFAARPGTVERRDALMRSRRLEEQVDRALEQGDLFGEAER